MGNIKQKSIRRLFVTVLRMAIGWHFLYEGLAKVVDEKTNSKLEVSFVSIFGFHLFWGDYWIIGLDKNYEYAVVGHPERKYGWILSRTPKLSEEKLNEAFDILKETGYDSAKFEMSRQ